LSNDSNLFWGSRAGKNFLLFCGVESGCSYDRIFTDTRDPDESAVAAGADVLSWRAGTEQTGL